MGAFGLNIVMSRDADRVITELETKTSTAHNAGMGGGGHIRVAVYTPEGICLTEILDSPHNDFESGHIDGFGKDDGLGRCYKLCSRQGLPTVVGPSRSFIVGAT